MSGGSYNYLCFKEDENLYNSGVLHDMDNMATALIEMGYNDAAKETLKLKYTIEQSLVRTQVMKERLEGIWKAVEWYENNDVGRETIEEEIKKYRGES